MANGQIDKSIYSSLFRIWSNFYNKISEFTLGRYCGFYLNFRLKKEYFRIIEQTSENGGLFSILVLEAVK